MNKIDLSIIIVSYNTPNLVYGCLKSIQKHLKLNHEVIIVENGSGEELRVKNEELRRINLNAYYLILNTNNKGFGSANNLGAEKARGKYLLLLNPDTIIVDDSIQKMLGFVSRHNEIGALTCLLYNDIKCKKIQKNFFGKFQTLAGLTIRRYNYQRIDRSKEFFYTDIVTGACLMTKRELFNRIRGFDQNIFMYLEDDDLCKRLVDMGYKNAVLNTARIIHLEGRSTTSREKKKFYYESQGYYWRKHNGLFATSLMKIIRWPIKIFKTK